MQQREDGSMLFELECATTVERPVLSLYARGELIRTWTSRSLVSTVDLCLSRQLQFLAVSSTLVHSPLRV